MNREQKAAAIEEVAGQIQESEAVFAVDYRGISVPQAAELRTRLTEAGARFRVVKNTLTQRAADQAGAEPLKEVLEGPTAFTFVLAEGGDVALAAKALANFRRETDLLFFKGGIMGGDALSVEQLEALSKLPSLDVLHGQLVGVIASPITGLVRGLNALIQGLVIQLGQIAEQGLVGGDAPAADEAPAEETAAKSAEAPAEETADAPADDAPADDAPADDAPADEAPADEESSSSDDGGDESSSDDAAEEPAAEDAPAEEAAADEAPADEAAAETAAEDAPADEAAAETAAEDAPADEAAAEEASPEPEGDGTETGETDAPSEGDEKE